MADSTTFTAHAARCHDEAEAATLDNVRERALRSKAAWNAMAARSLHTENSRDARKARELSDIAPEIFANSDA